MGKNTNNSPNDQRERSSKPAMFELDDKLGKYLNFREGFFIEAGANDGYNQSNTYYLASELGWKGVLIEGIPDSYEKCVRTRTESIVKHCALVAPDYQDDTVTMHYANLMSVVDGSLKTEDAQQEYLQMGVDVQKLDPPYSVDVPARTMTHVLDEIGDLPPIDFFSLDVEGSELSVLRGMDLKKYCPKYILVEGYFFYDDIHQYLTVQNYEFVEKITAHDYLYKAPA